MQSRKKQARSRQRGLGNQLERLHPALRTNFVPLPEAGETLTDEQLSAIFSGDLSAFRDVVQLVRHQIPKNTE